MFRGRVKQLIFTWQSSSQARSGIEGCENSLSVAASGRSSRRVTPSSSADPLEAKANLSSARTSSATPDPAFRIIILQHPLSLSNSPAESRRRFAPADGATRIDGCWDELSNSHELPSDSVGLSRHPRSRRSVRGTRVKTNPDGSGPHPRVCQSRSLSRAVIRDPERETASFFPQSINNP